MGVMAVGDMGVSMSVGVCMSVSVCMHVSMRAGWA